MELLLLLLLLGEAIGTAEEDDDDGVEDTKDEEEEDTVLGGKGGDDGGGGGACDAGGGDGARRGIPLLADVERRGLLLLDPLRERLERTSSMLAPLPVPRRAGGVGTDDKLGLLATGNGLLLPDLGC